MADAIVRIPLEGGGSRKKQVLRGREGFKSVSIENATAFAVSHLGRFFHTLSPAMQCSVIPLTMRTAWTFSGIGAGKWKVKPRFSMVHRSGKRRYDPLLKVSRIKH
jgi:hypothetical protein